MLREICPVYTYFRSALLVSVLSGFKSISGMLYVFQSRYKKSTDDCVEFGLDRHCNHHSHRFAFLKSNIVFLVYILSGKVVFLFICNSVSVFLL